MSERRVVLIDFATPRAGGFVWHKAREFCLLSPAEARAAEQRELVALYKPLNWTRPSFADPPATITAAEIARAQAELRR